MTEYKQGIDELHPLTREAVDTWHKIEERRRLRGDELYRRWKAKRVKK